MSTAINNELVREILAFAAEGKVWPTGRDYVASEWADHSESEEWNEVPPLPEDWAPTLNEPRTVKGVDIAATLYQAALRHADSGLPVYPDIEIPIENAIIQGRLERLGETIPFPIRFKNCIFEDGIHLKDSNIHSLQIKQSKVRFISLKRAQVDGSIVIERCNITDGLNLRGARINGLVGLKGSWVSDSGTDFRAVDLRNSKIGSSVFLRYGFYSSGIVNLSSAVIQGNLDCGNSSFIWKENSVAKRPIALKAKNAHIHGTVFLNRYFKSRGEVDFRRAHIGAQMSIRDASLEHHKAYLNLRKSERTGRPLFALNLENALIKQDLIINRFESLNGDIGLQNAETKTFVDEPAEWVKSAGKIKGKIWLSGFQYESISPTYNKARLRYRWLKAALPHHYLNDTFLRQPWDQLAFVLRRRGEDQAADLISVKAEARNLEQMIFKPRSDFFDSVFHFISLPALLFYLGGMRLIKFGYGFGYARIIALLGIIWTFNVVLYDVMASYGRMKPAEEEIVVYMEDKQRTNVPEYYIQFNSFIYGVDLIVPFELGQTNKWTPMISTEKALQNAETGFVSTGIMYFTDRFPALKTILNIFQPTIFGIFPKYWSWFCLAVGWFSFIIIGAAFAGSFRRQA